MRLDFGVIDDESVIQKNSINIKILKYKNDLLSYISVALFYCSLKIHTYFWELVLFTLLGNDGCVFPVVLCACNVFFDFVI